jgi:hypothetical protein
MMESATIVVFEDDETIVVHFESLPLIGDAVVLQGCGVFRVNERGWISLSEVNTGSFLRVSEIEGKHLAPTGQYEWLKKEP